jgi:hypothetical protein
MHGSCLRQRGPTGGLQAESASRSVVTKHGISFVKNYFLIFTPKDSNKEKGFLFHLLLYVQVSHVLLTSRPCRKMCVFQVKFVLILTVVGANLKYVICIQGAGLAQAV